MPLWSKARKAVGSIADSKVGKFWKRTGRFLWAIPVAAADISASKDKKAAFVSQGAALQTAFMMRNMKGVIPFIGPSVAYAITRGTFATMTGSFESQATNQASINQRIATNLINKGYAKEEDIPERYRDVGPGYSAKEAKDALGAFTELKKGLRKYGQYIDTGHKRIVVPKKLLSKEDLERGLGFVPVKIAVPEAGQTSKISYRHPVNLYHFHEHGNTWTMHEDRDPSLTMLMRRDRIEKKSGIGRRIAQTARGLPHALAEGVPGLYCYWKGKITGADTTLERLSRDLPSEYWDFINKVGVKFSGRDDAYNTIEGLRHGGMAGTARPKNTDFGSGYRKDKIDSQKQRTIGIYSYLGTVTALSAGIVAGDMLNKIMTNVATASPEQTRARLDHMSASIVKLNKYVKDKGIGFTDAIVPATGVGPHAGWTKEGLRYVGLPLNTPPEVWLHEYGHVLQTGKRISRKTSNFLASGIGVTSALVYTGALLQANKQRRKEGKKEFSKSLYLGAAFPLLAGSPLMYEEAEASIRGMRLGKKLGIIKDYKGANTLVKAFATYAALPVIASAAIALGVFRANRISGKDNAYNTVEALQHRGMAGKDRKKNTEFGSGWLGTTLLMGLGGASIGLPAGGRAGAIVGGGIGAILGLGLSRVKKKIEETESEGAKGFFKGVLAGTLLDISHETIMPAFVRGGLLYNPLRGGIEKTLDILGKTGLKVDRGSLARGYQYAFGRDITGPTGLLFNVSDIVRQRGVRRGIANAGMNKNWEYIDSFAGNPDLIKDVTKYGSLEAMGGKRLIRTTFVNLLKGLPLSIGLGAVGYMLEKRKERKRRNQAFLAIKGHDAGRWGRENTFATGDFVPGSSWRGIFGGIANVVRGVGRTARVLSTLTKETIKSSFRFIFKEVVPGILHGRLPETSYLVANAGQMIGLATGVPYSAANIAAVTVVSKGVYIASKIVEKIKPYEQYVRLFKQIGSRGLVAKLALRSAGRMAKEAIFATGRYIRSGELNAAGLFFEHKGSKLGYTAASIEIQRNTVDVAKSFEHVAKQSFNSLIFSGYDRARNTIEGFVEQGISAHIRKIFGFGSGRIRGIINALGAIPGRLNAARTLFRAQRLYKRAMTSFLEAKGIKDFVVSSDIALRQSALSLSATTKTGESIIDVTNIFKGSGVELAALDVAQNFRNMKLGKDWWRLEGALIRDLGYTGQHAISSPIISPKTAKYFTEIFDSGILVPSISRRFAGMSSADIKLGIKSKMYTPFDEPGLGKLDFARVDAIGRLPSSKALNKISAHTPRWGRQWVEEVLQSDFASGRSWVGNILKASSRIARTAGQRILGAFGRAEFGVFSLEQTSLFGIAKELKGAKEASTWLRKATQEDILGMSKTWVHSVGGKVVQGERWGTRWFLVDGRAVPQITIPKGPIRKGDLRDFFVHEVSEAYQSRQKIMALMSKGTPIESAIQASKGAQYGSHINQVPIYDELFMATKANRPGVGLRVSQRLNEIERYESAVRGAEGGMAKFAHEKELPVEKAVDYVINQRRLLTKFRASKVVQQLPFEMNKNRCMSKGTNR